MGAVSLNALQKSFPGSDSRRWLFYLIGNYDEFPIKQKHFVQMMRTRTRRNYCFASVLGAGKKAVLLMILFACVIAHFLATVKNTQKQIDVFLRKVTKLLKEYTIY